MVHSLLVRENSQVMPEAKVVSFSSKLDQQREGSGAEKCLARAVGIGYIHAGDNLSLILEKPLSQAAVALLHISTNQKTKSLNSMISKHFLVALIFNFVSKSLSLETFEQAPVEALQDRFGLASERQGGSEGIGSAVAIGVANLALTASLYADNDSRFRELNNKIDSLHFRTKDLEDFLPFYSGLATADTTSYCKAINFFKDGVAASTQFLQIRTVLMNAMFIPTVC